MSNKIEDMPRAVAMGGFYCLSATKIRPSNSALMEDIDYVRVYNAASVDELIAYKDSLLKENDRQFATAMQLVKKWQMLAGGDEETE